MSAMNIPLLTTRWDGRLPSRYMKKMYKVFPELKHYDFYHSTEVLRSGNTGPKRQITYRLGVRIMNRYLGKIQEIRNKGYGLTMKTSDLLITRWCTIKKTKI